MNKNYHFIPNALIGEDKFEGQSQEKIASVLVDILNDENFQIIGIDGTWGSSKSDLVEIENADCNGSGWYSQELSFLDNFRQSIDMYQSTLNVLERVEQKERDYSKKN